MITMASFFDEIAKNRLRSIILLLAFGALFTLVIYFFIWILGGTLIGLVIAAVIVLLYAIFTYQFGSNMVLKLSGAQPADRKQYPILYDAVEGMAMASQIKVPDIYVINDPSPNAFATGKDKKHASVAVTSGLLSIMNKNELEGVLAHEMSHIYDNDIQFMLLAVVFVGAIGLIAVIVRNMFFFGGIRGGGRRNGGVIVIIALVIGLLAPLFATLLRLAISRRREYMADANGARITRAPMFLASALKKIQQYEANPNAQPVAHVNEVTAPLYFASPFNAKSIMNLFSTHPPIEDRIDKLQHMY